MTQAAQPLDAGIRPTPQSVLTQQGDALGRIGGAIVLDEGVISLVDPSHGIVYELGDQPRIDV